ncbi:MAG: spore germination protein [Oscillospiraceae bacterium]|nr:spore germination protein [Oscillospiraceae bacterium]
MSTSSYTEHLAQLDNATGFGKCFDIKKRTLDLSGRPATLYYAASMTSNQVTERLIAACLSSPVTPTDTAESWSARSLTLGNLTLTDDLDQGAKEVRTGSSLLAVEGFADLLVTDAKMIPSRGINEPQHDQVLRGAREGFAENIMENTAILRRRLSSPDLHLEMIPIGDSAPTNVFLAFVEGRADAKYVDNIREKLQSIRVDALSLGQESLAECLIRRKWFNPFPKFRYTERPDAAAAMLLEGSILLFCDASPQAMVLPVGIFDFLQETDDFYFPPLIGTYLRFLRVSVFFLSLFLTPLWYLLIRNPDWIPEWLAFIQVKENPGLPVLIQILLVEFTIDWMKLASLNTPNMLGNSLSVVAGLILGDFAIQVGWLIPEVILYMAFVSMANFTQPSFELGYAFKFMRILLLIATAIAGAWGFFGGLAGIVLLICLNKTVDGSRSYLYPLIPLNKEVLFRMVFRVKLKQKENPSKH